ncbi:MAG: glycosidase [Candidatus Freyarchaeota archaeon]|nr:glycosidase [Thermotogaceae bacterium]
MKKEEKLMMNLIQEKRRNFRRNSTKNIFERLTYIFPNDVVPKNYRRNPVAVFNPGAFIKGKELHVFPRLIFDYYKYVSAVGHFVVNVEDLLDNVIRLPIETEIVLWPSNLQEFLGCEDPRVFYENDSIKMLYTGKGYKKWSQEGSPHTDFLAYAKLNKEYTVLERTYLSIKDNGEEFFPVSMKDSSFLSDCHILTRIDVEGLRTCWKGQVIGSSIPLESLEPVFFPEEWETKVGWSTNALRMENEFLIGWHAVLKEDLSYKNGLALVSKEGDLLASTDYVLSPRGLIEEYGDRAFVIFGCGLVIYEDLLIWIGGVSDYAIGFFAAKKREIFSHLRAPC